MWRIVWCRTCSLPFRAPCDPESGAVYEDDCPTCAEAWAWLEVAV